MIAMSTTVDRRTARPRPAVEAWKALFALMRSLEPHWETLAAEFDVSPAQGEVLISLERHTAVPMNQVARLCHCDASNVTHIVDKLEARGLVERRPAPNDRRVKLIALTDEGSRARERVLERLYEPPEAIARLTHADQRALRDLLRRAVEG